LSRLSALCNCLVSWIEHWTQSAVVLRLGVHALGPLHAEGECRAQRMHKTRGFFITTSVLVHASGLHKSNYMPLDWRTSCLRTRVSRQWLLCRVQGRTTLETPVIHRVANIVEHTACQYPPQFRQKVLLRSYRKTQLCQDRPAPPSRYKACAQT